MSERLGLMICGHGSRIKGAVEQFAHLAEGLKARFPDWPVEYGYLEFANPVIRDGLNELRAAGHHHHHSYPHADQPLGPKSLIRER